MQVIKAVLEDLGYEIRVIPKYRAAWKNHKHHNLNICVSTSISELTTMKREMIEEGRINIGEPIVPIDYDVVKINKQGKLVSNS